jgi:hypothetical protein
MGQFLNSFAQDPQSFWTAVAAVIAALGLFSWQYNAWIGRLGEKKKGYLGLLVAAGTLVILLGMAVISWKSAVLGLIFFAAGGSIMILGDIGRSVQERERTSAKKGDRRKPLPYAAAGLIDEASMSLAEAQRDLRAVLAGKGDDKKLGLIALSLASAIQKLSEAKKVEGD